MKGTNLVPGEIVDVEYVACPGCGDRRELIIDSDGNGGLLESMKECPTCRPSRIVVIPAGHKALTCQSCQRTFAEPLRRGPLPPSLSEVPMMATVRHVRDLGFCYEVSTDGFERPATVIHLDYERREFYCASCDDGACDHAHAVLMHVVDRENR